MKLCTYSKNGEPGRAGLALAGGVIDVATASAARGTPLLGGVRALLERGPEALAVLRKLASQDPPGPGWIPESEVRFLAAIPDPPTIYLLAANYQSHITESGAPPVDKTRITPRPFVKPGTAIIGTGDPILVPPDSETLDYEIEIAAVIGTGGRLIDETAAPEHVAGYAVFNDVSARSLAIAKGRTQRNGDWFFDWLLGKWCDSFAVLGPYLVTRDEISDPAGLEMSLRVNGELRQHSSAGEMIFTIPEAIAFLSRFVTLRPGDLLCMGTPGGVGVTTDTYLQPGDIVEGTIDRLGTIRNEVQQTP